MNTCTATAANTSDIATNNDINNEIRLSNLLESRSLRTVDVVAAEMSPLPSQDAASSEVLLLCGSGSVSSPPVQPQQQQKKRRCSLRVPLLDFFGCSVFYFESALFREPSECDSMCDLFVAKMFREVAHPCDNIAAMLVFEDYVLSRDLACQCIECTYVIPSVVTRNLTCLCIECTYVAPSEGRAKKSLADKLRSAVFNIKNKIHRQKNKDNILAMKQEEQDTEDDSWPPRRPKRSVANKIRVFFKRLVKPTHQDCACSHVHLFSCFYL